VHKVLQFRYGHRCPATIDDIKEMYYFWLTQNLDEPQNFAPRSSARALSSVEIATGLMALKLDYQRLEYPTAERNFKKRGAADEGPTSEECGEHKKQKIAPGPGTHKTEKRRLDCNQYKSASARSEDDSGETGPSTSQSIEPMLNRMYRSSDSSWQEWREGHPLRNTGIKFRDAAHQPYNNSCFFSYMQVTPRLSQSHTTVPTTKKRKKIRNGLISALSVRGIQEFERHRIPFNLTTALEDFSRESSSK